MIQELPDDSQDSRLKLKLSTKDFHKRKTFNQNHHPSSPINFSLSFDESGSYLFVSHMAGIAMIQLSNGEILKVIGKVENTERFIQV
jgi:hypothetical protein